MMEKSRVRTKMRWTGAFGLLAALLCCVAGITGHAQAPADASNKEPAYDVEYYYKVQWGHADEWLALFKKNHLPVLKALKEQGRLVVVEIEKPRYHMTEDARWDFRVTITWKNVNAATDSSGEPAIIRKLFPDQETFKREEQRRFEILLAHWDLPVQEVSLEP